MKVNYLLLRPLKIRRNFSHVEFIRCNTLSSSKHIYNSGQVLDDLLPVLTQVFHLLEASLLNALFIEHLIGFSLGVVQFNDNFLFFDRHHHKNGNDNTFLSTTALFSAVLASTITPLGTHYLNKSTIKNLSA